MPPHELRGPLGQLGDAGGGIVPALMPAPVPYAMQSTPGLATGATAPPNAPTLPSDDQGSLALLISKLAGEAFGGSSLHPFPAPGNATALTSTGSAPAPSGLSPMAASNVPTTPSGVPSDPTIAAVPSRDGSAWFGMPPQPPVSAGSHPTSYASPSYGSSAPAVPSGSSVPAPTGSHASVPSGSNAGVPGLAGSQATAPAHASGSPGTHGAFYAPASPAATSPSHALAGGGSSIPGLPNAYGTPAASTPPGSAFAFPTISEVPMFGADPWGAAGSELRMPASEQPAIDAAPYFMPSADVLGLDTATDFQRIEVGNELAPAREPLTRELGGTAFDPYVVRKDFPILDERVQGGKRLVWLDNAATTQKPRAVIDRLSSFYEHENSNIHRAAHTLAARATDAYERGRELSRKFLNAPSAQEIIFVRGATEGINLVAQSWGRKNINAGDEILITHLEHHANIVPWQMLCAERGARLKVAPVDDRGDVILEAYDRLLTPKTKLVAFPQVSNALGTITPAQQMVELAHRHGAVVLVDGAQAVSHMPVDVQLLDCDFYVFSGHKVFAPTGIGVVYGKREILEDMPPWQGGGNMIQDVTFERTTYHPPPFRFEAGTGNIADAAGLGAALEYVMKIGLDTIDRYEHELLVYATQRLHTVPGLTMIGTSPNKAGVLSFILNGQRTEDVGAALDKDGIAVRSGHHCAQPILRRFGLEATVRASLAFYNIVEDIDALVDSLCRLQGAGVGIR
ncbi:MAG: family 2A encapsulin nanocompartment cargo protein cysteine desulfurase [Kofleriaceae bacterium]